MNFFGYGFKVIECLENKYDSLSLLNCGISDTEEIENLGKCKHLVFLDLGWNNITNISSLKELPNLQILRLDSNNLADINSIKYLPKIKSLFLSQNQISDCKILSEMSELEQLDLSKNQISDISSLSKLKKIKYLNLSNNKIRNIPIEIFKLGLDIHLHNAGGGININGNPIESPPIEIINQGNRAVLSWFGATKKNLNEIKIILVGEPKAGKTSLLRRFKFNDFNENEKQTDGINIEDLDFSALKIFEKQKKLHNIIGHIWDFGGQEIMNSTHQFFLTNRSIYIVVIEARKDSNISENIRNWIRKIKITGGNSPIIIVANQMDINPGFGFEHEYELRKEFPQICQFIKISCCTGENIEELTNSLEEIIPQADLFKIEIDEKWFPLKDKLQEETKIKFFLNETRFKEICNESEIFELEEQKNAITFFHDIGIILHFEGINLSEYYVLDPYWITYGVYQILTSTFASKKQGIVSIDSLEYIVNVEKEKKEKYEPVNFKKIEYSFNERRFLVDILNQFKLCFYINDHNNFIIPDLISTVEPIGLTNSIKNSKLAIRFVYEFSYLPKSVMTNFIVVTHYLCTNIWRTGCILNNNNCTALVSKYNNRIIVTVLGEHKKNREFLAVIRHVIDNIVQKFSEVPKLLVPHPGINIEIDYEELLQREALGETSYKVFISPQMVTINIPKLLEGLPKKSEIFEIQNKLDFILAQLQGSSNRQKLLAKNLQEVNLTINNHYNYLISFFENNNDLEAINKSIEDILLRQSNEILLDIEQWFANVFDLFETDLDEKLKKIYFDIKNSDNWNLKMSLSIPFMYLLGLEIKADFDVKKWALKMYEKHELLIFKMMGYL